MPVTTPQTPPPLPADPKIGVRYTAQVHGQGRLMALAEVTIWARSAGQLLIEFGDGHVEWMPQERIVRPDESAA